MLKFCHNVNKQIKKKKSYKTGRRSSEDLPLRKGGGGGSLSHAEGGGGRKGFGGNFSTNLKF